MKLQDMNCYGTYVWSNDDCAVCQFSKRCQQTAADLETASTEELEAAGEMYDNLNGGQQ